MLRNADGGGFSGKKRYEDVRYNIISVMKGWVAVQFPGEKCYVTLEWPLGTLILLLLIHILGCPVFLDRSLGISKLSAKYQFCAIHTGDITDGKVHRIRERESPSFTRPRNPPPPHRTWYTVARQLGGGGGFILCC